MIEYYVKINFGDVCLPKVKLNKKEAVVEESAEKDKMLKDMGVQFTKEYFMKKYNLTEGDFQLKD